MKKNLRIVSVAAAALLAVAPVATSVVPTVGANVVQAAGTNFTGGVNTGNSGATGNAAANQGTTTNIANAPTDRPFFARNYQAIDEPTEGWKTMFKPLRSFAICSTVSPA